MSSANKENDNSIDEEQKKEILVLLNRIEGQVRGLQKMVQQDKYCVDILTQISAVRGALKKVGLNVLESHTHGCVKRAVKNKNQDGQEILDELMDVFAKFTE